ncbi:MAG: hypothetical protein HGB11_04375, partial [Chlorobiales bacterium]|nr:hypothetical protein [Chlorobiales bacterium]
MRSAKSSGIVSAAQRVHPHVEYEVSFDNRLHHEAEITATFTELPSRP